MTPGIRKLLEDTRDEFTRLVSLQDAHERAGVLHTARDYTSIIARLDAALAPAVSVHYLRPNE